MIFPEQQTPLLMNWLSKSTLKLIAMKLKEEYRDRKESAYLNFLVQLAFRKVWLYIIRWEKSHELLMISFAEKVLIVGI